MTVETEIRTRLAADGTIAGLVGTRIQPVNLEQSVTYPAISYNKVSAPRVHNLAGVAGRAFARISYNSWAETYVGCQTLAAAIRASLDGFQGTLTTTTCVITLENEIDLFEDEVNVYRIVQDYFVSHAE